MPREEQRKSRLNNIAILKFIKSFFPLGIPLLALLWMSGIIFEMIRELATKDYSMFLGYAELSLTFFGFTLLSGIFDKGKASDDKIPERSKMMFYFSLLFLLSAISFLFLYSTAFIFDSVKPDSIGNIKLLQVVTFFDSIAIPIGLLALVYGAIFFFTFLLNTLIEIETKQQQKRKEYEKVKPFSIRQDIKNMTASDWLITILCLIVGIIFLIWFYS